MVLKLWNKFKNWCGKDTAGARCARSVFQAAVGIIINFVPDFITGSTVIPYEMKPVVQGVVMSVLAPVQKRLGARTE